MVRGHEVKVSVGCPKLTGPLKKICIVFYRQMCIYIYMCKRQSSCQNWGSFVGRAPSFMETVTHNMATPSMGNPNYRARDFRLFFAAHLLKSAHKKLHLLPWSTSWV